MTDADDFARLQAASDTYQMRAEMAEEAAGELAAEVERLRDSMEEAHLARIEAQNPGIDIDEVRRLRASPNAP